MSTRKYRVTCEDGETRHGPLFADKAAAQHWAEWGHACTRTHTITATTDLADMESRLRDDLDTRWVNVHVDSTGNGRTWVKVEVGPYTAMLCCMAVGEGDDAYLDIDVHPFVDGDHATAGVFGMSEGYRAALDTRNMPEGKQTTSQGWPSANMLAVLVGKQTTEQTNAHTEEAS